MGNQILDLTGKAIFFGGPYGNIQALTALKKWAEDNQVPRNQIVCTGDVVAYCAAAEESVDFIREWGISVIAGNVELQLANSADHCGCNFNKGSDCEKLSEIWYSKLKDSLSDSSIEWMRNLPKYLRYTMAGKKIAVVHGARDQVSQYIFASSPWEIKRKEIQSNAVDLVVAGHCGIPFYQIEDKYAWVNPGALGMPANDGTPRVWFSYFENLANLIYLHICPLEYDYSAAADDIEAELLPLEYAETLRNGLWYNCDILPEIETLNRGLRLSFDVAKI